MSNSETISNKASKSDEKPKGGFIRENIESLTVAVVMALLIKQFAFEAYAVPTESMEPMIIGREVGGDRLIVNKYLYMMRDPRRFEIVVFRYPLNKLMNYVKRCIGLPNEWVFLRNGDVWTASGDLGRDEALKVARTAKKPDGVQEALFDLLNCIPPEDRGIDRFDKYWDRCLSESKGRSSVDEDEDVVNFKAEAGETWRRFSRPNKRNDEPDINNERYDDYAPRNPDTNVFSKILGMAWPANGIGPPSGVEDAVGDVRLSFEVSPSADKGACLVRLRDGTHELPIDLVLAVEGTSETSSLVIGKEKKDIQVKLESDEFTSVEIWNVDDTVRVLVDGDEVARMEYTHPPIEVVGAVLAGSEVPEEMQPPGPQPTHKLPYPNSVSFGFRDGDASFREIELARDVYYTYSHCTDFHIPADHYLMCGDNSPNSLDCRGFRQSVMEYRFDDGVRTLTGDAEAVTDLDRPEDLRPFKNPYASNSRFRDDYGNIWYIDPDRIVSTKVRYENLIPRDHIMGRAYVTFWPPLQIGVIR